MKQRIFALAVILVLGTATVFLACQKQNKTKSNIEIGPQDQLIARASGNTGQFELNRAELDRLLSSRIKDIKTIESQYVRIMGGHPYWMASGTDIQGNSFVAATELVEDAAGGLFLLFASVTNRCTSDQNCEGCVFVYRKPPTDSTIIGCNCSLGSGKCKHEVTSVTP